MESQLDKLGRNLKSDEHWTSTTIYRPSRRNQSELCLPEVLYMVILNYNIMLCIEFSSLRLKCDMGEVFEYCSVSRKGSQACWKRA